MFTDMKFISYCIINELYLVVYNILNFTVGYVGGKKNPLSNVYFYNFKTGNIIPENKVKNFSLLINQKHMEHFIRIYCLGYRGGLGNNNFYIILINICRGYWKCHIHL